MTQTHLSHINHLAKFWKSIQFWLFGIMTIKAASVHFSEIQGQPAENAPANRVKCIDANFSQHFGLKRVGVHHVTVAPGYRTSYPHAESLEEEFVYVISGTVHAWINGFLYEMKAGWAVGFPSGTGIAHTFINNSQEDVQLLVAGERTKNENLCSFPINPELKASSGIWWDNYPQQTFGPHSGLPGPMDSEHLKTECPPGAVYVPELRPGGSFHYPGDNETFDVGVRLTDQLGLKALGIWFQTLPPGRRSCFPHAHTHEEEFAFILEGTPKVWLNGEVESLRSGEAIAFLPHSGISHCLINDSDRPVTYIGIGEVQEFPDEKIIYPLNPLRNKECQRKNWYWANAPTYALGPHNGRPTAPFPDHLKLRLAQNDDAAEVLKIFETSPTYFRNVEGCFPTIKSATHSILDGPTKTGQTYFKEFLIIEQLGKPIGTVDLHCDHPEPGITYLGLLLIGEHLFGQGLGRRCYELVEDYVKRSFGSKSIRLGISDSNDVSGFWIAMGFHPNGKTYSWHGEGKVTNVTEYDKNLG